MSERDTRTRILDAAERLFAEKGFAATSLRAITGEAGVNLAAVNYHFGTKQSLVEAVFRRRVEPVSQARLDALDALEARFPTGPAPLEEILQAFFGPMVLLSRDPERWPSAMRIYTRVSAEPDEAMFPLLTSVFADVARRYLDAIGRSLPQLSPRELGLRFHLGIGAMVHVLGNLSRLPGFSPDSALPRDPGEIVPHLVAYAAAGLRAPAVQGPSET